MKNKKLLLTYYYLLLIVCLAIVFYYDGYLRNIVGVTFCFSSSLLYYQIRKKRLNNKDCYFIYSLWAAACGCVYSYWRQTQLGMNSEMLAYVAMLVFFIQSIKHEKQYLFLGTKTTLFIGVIIIFFSILYFSNQFLPYINDINTPLSILFVFVLGFTFIITLNREPNTNDYLLLFIGICFIVASSIVVAISFYNKPFAFDHFLEDMFFLVGICFQTIGMLKSHSYASLSAKVLHQKSSFKITDFIKKAFL